MSEATAKLNIVFPEATEYTLFPLSFTGKHKNEKGYNPFAKFDGAALPRSEEKVLALIYTYRKNFGKNAKITQAIIRRKCGLSKGGARNALHNLINRQLIEDEGDGVYKIIPNIPKIDGKRYIVLENYLHTMEFDINGVKKTLTQSAVQIFEYVCSFYREFETDPETGERIYTHYNFRDRKVIEYFCGSEVCFAKWLNIPKSTAADAIKELIDANLLRRNKRLRYKDENGNVRHKIVQTKGTPGNTLSWFTVPYEALAVEQRSTYEPQKLEFIDELPEIEVTETEIQAAYSELRTEAQTKAEQARKIANGDKEFNEIQSELMQAECLSDFDKFRPSYIKSLAKLGLTEADLSPQYQCTLCDDTGQNIDTGQRCICRHQIKQRIKESKLKA